MAIISIVIILLYLLLIGRFVFSFDRIKDFQLRDLPAKTSFSVVIPFRNESNNLPDLLHSISQLEYPNHLFEIIFVDDDSSDDSVAIIKQVLDTFSLSESTPTDIRVIKNERTSKSPKKDAINTAIKQAKNKWIITTDADCTLPKYWLRSFDEFIQLNESKCIVAPVAYNKTNGFLNRFQLLDLLSLQGATIGGFALKKPFLCNGANFAYQKELFIELRGFQGNTNIASGDDIFLLEKIVNAYPNHVHYLKSEYAIVSTKPQPSWALLIAQRLRWASKTSAYNNGVGKLTGLIVLMTNALIIILALLSALSMFNFKIFLYIVFIKLNIDFILIYKSASFLNQREALISYIPSFFIYPFICVYIAFLSSFKTYKWKGRTFRK
ncbi:glycosyltransferase [Seonamhaeicola aphaedonensis]|uniref:Cellulose synthase/poly-beta-1,6-N-acetylglucosamine synthase-like glycosyltransferase n=1 Tax=Seonamhaeicola aphaedonensis TaxID=1461338 RepID=A0A3D9H967_9FLAO|nr:glycosyltransferase [Seonamhaeicola aphaedonensis]RED45711.1 cellulose synthase/poly-beta-1,6-N-acetylglucosamine synthase-like glycosyltransferase [Seonamhaeicola aphaedonensis]